LEKRVTFRGWMLPLLLIAPQVLISAIFFYDGTILNLGDVMRHDSSAVSGGDSG